ncbi:hypothetical protein BMS3Abin05_02434 [bacterium BMS3Abin05]|nr:hypothetical protein BMS3Abin05_02434 [bacterium BMS3Abin05]
MSQEVFVKTGNQFIDNFYPLIKSFLMQDTMDVLIDNKPIRGYRSPDSRAIWIRDYSDMMRGFKYFETDIKSVVEHFAETQAANGRIFDYFATFPEKPPCERENWTKYVRVPVEADVEYRFVKAAFLSWQASGDDLWMEHLLPQLEKALGYVLKHPWRWDETLQLVKRAYTIDTWDFAYTAGKHDWLQFQIDENTYWGVMHGDNSGYYEAFLLLAQLYNYFNQTGKSNFWRNKAEMLKTQLNKLCWNGNFYTHFLKITPVEIPGVDESAQLSLSNPMAINRGVTTHGMAVSILQEYLKRKAQNEAIFEWFSIDPPFPSGIFGDEKLVAGAYINGGIFPLVGGELARAAFDHGFEAYGVDILKRYYDLISGTGETYLWYFPDGTPASIDTGTSPEAMPTDGWGSSTMLYALFEGLVGIQDLQKLYEKILISPKWAAAGIPHADVQIGYKNSGRSVAYTFDLRDGQIRLAVQAPRADARFHILLPEHHAAKAVFINGRPADFLNTLVEKSPYVDFQTGIKGKTEIEIQMEAR